MIINNKIKVTKTEIKDLLIIEPKIFEDERGFFYESFSQQDFNEATGLNFQFVQDNHSLSKRGILRGLHYQLKNVQGKLVRVTSGSVFDVAVDLRYNSASFGKWFGQELSVDNRLQMWIPPGFAHGFLVLTDFAEFLYKTTDYYDPQSECCLIWNDNSLNIKWPLDKIHIPPQLNLRDLKGLKWNDAPKF